MSGFILIDKQTGKEIDQEWLFNFVYGDGLSKELMKHHHLWTVLDEDGDLLICDGRSFICIPKGKITDRIEVRFKHKFKGFKVIDRETGEEIMYFNNNPLIIEDGKFFYEGIFREWHEIDQEKYEVRFK